MPNGLALAIILLVIMLFAAYIVSLLLNFIAPFYTTPRSIVNRIVDLFQLKSKDKFVDLGSGDGRMVFSTYNRYKCKSVGYEISPILLIFVKLKKLFFTPFNPKVVFKEADFFKADLSEYNVVYCCLPEETIASLEKKFEEELQEGTKLFTYKYTLPNRKGEEIEIEGKKVYQYTF
jgi:SAM-dependent methyltransferase